MGRSGSPKHLRHIPDLPDDLMHIIFSQLKFRDKIFSGQVCKHWDRLLKENSAAARHWEIAFNIDSLVSCLGNPTTAEGLTAEQSSINLGRYGRGYPFLKERAMHSLCMSGWHICAWEGQAPVCQVQPLCEFKSRWTQLKIAPQELIKWVDRDIREPHRGDTLEGALLPTCATPWWGIVLSLTT
jgi:hypothetical protein